MSTQELIAAALRVADAFDAKTAPEAWMQQELREACAALLAHIQRGAVPMKLNVGFYTLVAEKPIAEHSHPEWRHMYRIVADDNGRVLGYISDPSMLAATPAPDHSGDATEMAAEPAEVPMPERLADAIVREVAELPDRDSPADWPAAMLVTSDELRGIVLAALREEVKP